jgi:hypothetical protein
MDGLGKKEALEILQNAFGVDPDDTLKEFRQNIRSGYYRGTIQILAEPDKTLTVYGKHIMCM